MLRFNSRETCPKFRDAVASANLCQVVGSLDEVGVATYEVEFFRVVDFAELDVQ